MIAQDFFRQRVLATESIAELMRPIHGAPPAGGLWPSKSVPGRFVWLRDKLSGQTICTATAARRVAPRACPPAFAGAGSAGCKQGDGRNEYVHAGGKKTSEDASSAVWDRLGTDKL